LVEERTAARIAIEQFGIRARGAGSLVTELSGGNAQKVVFAKWLSHSTNLLLLDEPTAGIDIGARRELMRFVRDRAANGLAVLMVSSDFQELLDSCDRILVMRGGVIAAERRAQDTSEDELILFASTGSIGSKTDAN
jgi:ribose transport system ATP-binding protein